MKLQAAARLKEGPGHPTGRKTQQPPALVQSIIDDRLEVGFNDIEGRYRFHEFLEGEQLLTAQAKTANPKTRPRHIART